jgi:hypothetical protein
VEKDVEGLAEQIIAEDAERREQELVWIFLPASVVPFVKLFCVLGSFKYSP